MPFGGAPLQPFVFEVLKEEPQEDELCSDVVRLCRAWGRDMIDLQKSVELCEGALESEWEKWCRGEIDEDGNPL